MLDLPILPLRVRLAGLEQPPEIKFLRSVWGRALHLLDRDLWGRLFEGNNGGKDRNPAYLLRPAPGDDPDAFEWLLFGQEAVAQAENLCRAWDVAGGMGVGKNRQPFTVPEIRPVGPDGAVRATTPKKDEAWPLALARWPLPGDPAATPCKVIFDAPLRLLAGKKLLPTPGLADIATAFSRRVRPFLEGAALAAWTAQEALFIATARKTVQEPWRGKNASFSRWSGRQHAVVELRGICGSIALPLGPGPLWPLLAAARWMHLGKGTVFGLGKMEIRHAPPS